MKGWTTTLTLLMASFAQAASLQQTGNWMQSWIERTDEGKGREYDCTTASDFIENSGESSVFSPISSELNVLLQACAGEYGQAAKDQSTDYMNKLMGALERMDSEKLKASNRVYIPTDSDDMCPKEGSGYSLRRYTREEGSSLCIEHMDWVKTESNNKLKSSLEAKDFTSYPLNRIYASLVYFKDQWHEGFLEERAEDNDFHLKNGGTVPRQFMTRRDYFPYKAYGGEDDGFDMVAVPYVGKDAHGEFTCYMVYLVPRKTDANLSEVWESFYKSADSNIGWLLCGCFQKKVCLAVPKIEKLRSSLKLKEILKSTYGNGPAELLDSRMVAYIDVDEEGTEAAALTETVYFGCSRPESVLQVRANRPYIAFVYEMTLNRVLFVVKDMGKVPTKLGKSLPDGGTKWVFEYGGNKVIAIIGKGNKAASVRNELRVIEELKKLGFETQNSKRTCFISEDGREQPALLMDSWEYLASKGMQIRDPKNQHSRYGHSMIFGTEENVNRERVFSIMEKLSDEVVRLMSNGILFGGDAYNLLIKDTAETVEHDRSIPELFDARKQEIKIFFSDFTSIDDWDDYVNRGYKSMLDENDQPSKERIKNYAYFMLGSCEQALFCSITDEEFRVIFPKENNRQHLLAELDKIFDEIREELLTSIVGRVYDVLQKRSK